MNYSEFQQNQNKWNEASPMSKSFQIFDHNKNRDLNTVPTSIDNQSQNTSQSAMQDQVQNLARPATPQSMSQVEISFDNSVENLRENPSLTQSPVLQTSTKPSSSQLSFQNSIQPPIPSIVNLDSIESQLNLNYTHPEISLAQDSQHNKGLLRHMSDNDLYHQMKFSQREASRRLGVSISTLKRELHRRGIHVRWPYPKRKTRKDSILKHSSKLQEMRDRISISILLNDCDFDEKQLDWNGLSHLLLNMHEDKKKSWDDKHRSYKEDSPCMESIEYSCDSSNPEVESPMTPQSSHITITDSDAGHVSKPIYIVPPPPSSRLPPPPSTRLPDFDTILPPPLLSSNMSYKNSLPTASEMTIGRINPILQPPDSKQSSTVSPSNNTQNVIPSSHISTLKSSRPIIFPQDQVSSLQVSQLPLTPPQWTSQDPVSQIVQMPSENPAKHNPNQDKSFFYFSRRNSA